MVRLYSKGPTEMKLKVTARSKERSMMGKGSFVPYSMLYALCSVFFALLLFASHSYCETSENLAPEEFSTLPQVSSVQDRPAIVDAIRPVYLPKTTKLEIVSDRPLKIKQMKLSQSGVLRIEIFNATTSLPDSVTIDKGLLRGVAFDTERDELRIYISLTGPVIYDVESTDQGLVVAFQNPVLEQLISLNINNESLTTVLLMLFIEYGANIVAGSDVSGTVTAHLVDVPLKAALYEILEAEGYGYMESGGLIRVMPISKLEAIKAAKGEFSITSSLEPVVTESKVFQLRFAKALDIQSMVEKLIGNRSTMMADARTNSLVVISTPEEIVKIGELIAQLDKVAPAGGVGQVTDDETLPTQEEIIAVIPIKKVFKLNYMSPELASALVQPFLSAQGTVEAVEEEVTTAGGGGGGGGAAGGGMQLGTAVGQGGYIIVSDIPENMERIQEEIPKFDVPVPQVEIEAYIVEGTLSSDSDLGINWAAISNDEDMQFSFSPDLGGVLTKGIITAEKFTGILQALATNSELNVLSNPRITTMENQPAIFHSGDRIPYNRIIVEQGIQTVDTVFEDVGIVLTAIPQVKEGNMISLVLGTSVSSEGGFTPTGQPRIATRTTQSQVLVKSGDTVVIAGLISEKSTKVVSKVPIIGDIPLIGRVFSTEREVKQKSEVTIFITPRIIP